VSARLDLYHRTSEDAARAVLATGRFVTRENTPEAYASTDVDGQAAGYGPAVVHVRVDEADAELEDEFPDGEQHFRIPLDRAEVVEAFTVSPGGERTPLLPAVTMVARDQVSVVVDQDPRQGLGPAEVVASPTPDVDREVDGAAARRRLREAAQLRPGAGDGVPRGGPRR